MTKLYKPESYGVKYLGSKLKLLPHIQKIVQGLEVQEKSVIDVFTGTTRVSQMFRKMGFRVTSSDLAYASEAYASLFLCHPQPTSLLPFLKKLQEICEKKESELPMGWISSTYCDVLSETKRPIRVWKLKNGKRADAIREQIHNWQVSGRIDHQTALALTAALIISLDKVDNTVGVQQSYLLEWKASRADNDLDLSWCNQELLQRLEGEVLGQHLRGNSQTLQYVPASIAYLDPPYTNHNYGSYYHIWESIALWDKPEVGLSTNRRVDRIFKEEKLRDQEFVSSWYRKKEAVESLNHLVRRLPVKCVLLSYNDEGLMSPTEIGWILVEMLASGIIKEWSKVEIDHKRNVMSQIGKGAPSQSRKNKEIIYVIEKLEKTSSP